MLQNFVPSGTFIAPRLMEERLAASPFGVKEAEALSGSLIAVAGDVPILTHAAASPPALISAIEDAGLGRPQTIDRYHTRAEYLALLRDRQVAGETAWFTFPVPEGQGSDGAVFVTPECLNALNDRRAVNELVPEGSVPKRRILDGSEAVASELSSLGPGHVVKLLGEAASSGGAGVQVIRRRGHLARAKRKLAGAASIVIEDLISADRNICAQVAVKGIGRLEWLGGCEQIISSGGIYLGNRIDQDIPASVRDLALEIARRGATRGFRGIAGFDILVTPTGPIAVDLNFRPNGSTPFLMLSERLGKERGARFAEFVFPRWNGLVDNALASVRPEIEAGYLVPTGAYDPSLAGLSGAPSSLRFVVFAPDRRTLGRRISKLSDKGFEIPSHPVSPIRRIFRRLRPAA